MNPERLVELAADGQPIPQHSHESTCTYCQALLEELSQLWQPVRHWAAQDTPIPQDFLIGVVRRVRRIAQSPHHIAATTARGATTVTSWVLGLIASTTTLRSPGVTNMSGPSPKSLAGNSQANIRYGADGVEITEVDAAAVSIALEMVANGEADLNKVADTVRDRVIVAIRAATNIEVREVNININDIIET
jgi:uncharacterized alkaline shock family protein YloU